jgi:8-oxo-dGTP diphosphatase
MASSPGPIEYIHAVIGILRRDGQVVLVQQQEPDLPAPFLTLPGGGVEHGEPLPAALAREMREETGVELDGAARLAFVLQHDDPAWHSICTWFVFECAGWRGDLRPDDPDGSIVAVETASEAEAVARLAARRWPIIAEAAPAWLEGRIGQGDVWFYQRTAQGENQRVDAWSAVALGKTVSQQTGTACEHRGRTVVHCVAALLRDGDDVLLVRQQGPSDRRAYWALPGGVAEAGELLCDALGRELREETGLRLAGAPRLAYIAQQESKERTLLVFAFDCPQWSGEIHIADPDAVVLGAAFLPVPEAVGKLRALPWAAMRRPAVAYLLGEAEPGALWVF